MFSPSSVVDVGCGIGTFLAAFKDAGVNDLLGLDGNWVNKSQLCIDEKYFTEIDLESPIDLERRFDIAVCLEVAEHLSPGSADKLVQTLCSASDLIIFSAALPGQGGENHLNEQLAEYWQEKFLCHDFYFFDIFRERYWHNSDIDWWYKQNMFLVARSSATLPSSVSDRKVDGTVNTYVHPEPFLHAIREMERARANLESLKSVSGVLKAIPKLARSKFFRH
jgi:SAM-dependent methyltransferase